MYTFILFTHLFIGVYFYLYSLKANHGTILADNYENKLIENDNKILESPKIIQRLVRYGSDYNKRKFILLIKDRVKKLNENQYKDE